MSRLNLARLFFGQFFALMRVYCLVLAAWQLTGTVFADETAANNPPQNIFDVREYVVHGNISLPSDVLNSIFARHMGTNIDLSEIARAASDLQAECAQRGLPAIGVAIGETEITNGVVTLNVFQTATPQIVINGQKYFTPTNVPAIAANPAPAIMPIPFKPATSEEIVRAREALDKKMDELAFEEKNPRIRVVSTNSGPRFDVENYLVLGNSLLTPGNIGEAITNIDGAYGTNVCLDGIQAVVEQLQKTYNDRGFGLTVNVGLPQQTLSNATVKVQVTEGRLAAINVKGNRYFSSNNVMSALPGLHTNMILNSYVFQSELNQANANQDRQIYPVIGPGPDPGTSELTLNVKDTLPIHGKTELNNENSPGTPVLRENSSIAFDNLWQLNQSLGLQYAFSPESYKAGNQWDFYDGPSIANYGGFYRLPLGGPESVQDVISSDPNSFGYSEETRKFTLPPSSGQMDLTFYANRSTTDTGIQTLSTQTFGTNAALLQIIQEDMTVNQTLGFRFNKPLPQTSQLQSTLSGGLDFKTYALNLYRTNLITYFVPTNLPNGQTTNIAETIPAPAVAVESFEYLPLTLRYDGTLRGPLGTLTMGLGVTANPWYIGYSGTTNKFQLSDVTGSKKSTGYWVTVDPSVSWSIPVYTNWMLLLNANGQWASEPLISSEQFGAGGVNSVRGYHEGEVFGDEGWRFSAEQQTPPYVLGMAYDNVPLTVRGSVYMDYARAILIDPQGRPPAISLWGVGVGTTASIGSHWDATFLFSVPLSNAGTTGALQPYFNFSLTAQF